MSYFRFNALQRSRIAYGCIVALGSITAAGIAEIEIEGKVFSKGIKSVSETIQAGMSSPSGQEQSNQVTAETIFYPFTYVGQEVAKISKQVGPFLQKAPSVIDFFKKSGKEVIGGFGKFLSNLIEPQIFNKIFDNIHKKVGNFISFFLAGGEARSSFIGLFKDDKGTNTSSAMEFLLGKEIKDNKYFKAKPEVFSYLLLGGMDDPSKITGKFDRLLTTIKGLTERLKEVSASSSGGDESNKTYGLDTSTVDAYLNVPKGGKESIFNGAGRKRVISKIKTGTDNQTEAKLGVSDTLSQWGGRNGSSVGK